MNKIFERVMDIEGELNELITDIQTQVESCPNNENAILDALITASLQISKVYKLNKENFSQKIVDKYGDWS